MGGLGFAMASGGLKVLDGKLLNGSTQDGWIKWVALKSGSCSGWLAVSEPYGAHR